MVHLTSLASAAGQRAGNIGQLTAALAKLMNNLQLCHFTGEKARAWVQKGRTWDNNARQVLEIARGLLCVM